MMLNLNQDYMYHMMDWGLNGWIFLILGGVLFLLFVIILLYFLSGKRYKKGSIKSSKYMKYNNNNYSEIQTQNYNSNEAPKEKEVNLEEPAFFCPSCGEQLDEKTLKYCPFCGSKI